MVLIAAESVSPSFANVVIPAATKSSHILGPIHSILVRSSASAGDSVFSSLDSTAGASSTGAASSIGVSASGAASVVSAGASVTSSFFSTTSGVGLLASAQARANAIRSTPFSSAVASDFILASFPTLSLI